VIEPVIELVPVANFSIDIAFDVERIGGELRFRSHE
jgi:hypothetical protein